MKSIRIYLMVVVLLCIAKFSQALAGAETDFPAPAHSANADGAEESPYDARLDPDVDTISMGGALADTHTVLQTAANFYDLRAIIPSDLIDSPSVSLRNVTLRQLYDHVLEDSDYTYRIESEFIYIEPRPDKIIQGIRDNTLYILSSTLLMSLGLNVFLVMRKPAAK